MSAPHFIYVGNDSINLAQVAWIRWTEYEDGSLYAEMVFANGGVKKQFSAENAETLRVLVGYVRSNERNIPTALVADLEPTPRSP